jgi:transcriptional regulator with XRE-family HTH domain
MSYAANRIKQLREEKDLNQSVVADELKMPRSALSMYENGRIPSMDHALALANYYHVSLDYIVGISSERSANASALVSSLMTLNNLAGASAPTASDVGALVDAAIVYMCQGKPCGEQPLVAWRDFMRQLAACLTAATQGDSAKLADAANAATIAALDVTKMPARLLENKGGASR